MNEHIAGSTLEDITRCLLDTQTSPGGVFTEAQKLHEYFSSVTGIHAHRVTYDKDIYLPTGKAIGPSGAAHCLLEGLRTAVFLRGVHDALQDLKARFPGQRLLVLYAGCGPYATLITPLTSVFSSSELAIHLMDINPLSLKAVEELYAHMGLQDYITDIELADAAIYKADEDALPHLIISETMQQSLQNEPQVAIMQNLVPQLADGGLFIPQEIVVSAQLLSGSEETKFMMTEGYRPERILLGNVYTISQQAVSGQGMVNVTIPASPDMHNTMYLMTDIKVYGDHVLTTHNCSLNLPVRIADIKEYAGREVSFSYQVSGKPGLTHKFN